MAGGQAVGQSVQPGVASAGYFTSAVLRGLPLALERGGYPPDVAQRAMNCVTRAAPTRITPVINEFLKAHFSADELKDLDAFFESPVGAKFKRIAEVAFLRKYGKTKEDLPALTPDEQAAYDDFVNSPAGRKFSSPEVQGAARPGTPVDQKVGLVMRECQAKVISGR